MFAKFVEVGKDEEFWGGHYGSRFSMESMQI